MANQVLTQPKGPASDPASVTAADERFAQFEKEREQGRRLDTLQEVIKAAGGDRYRGYTFESWKASTSAQQGVKAAVTEWAESYPDRRAACENLILYGPCGTGKDHLAMAAVGLVILRFGPVGVRWWNGREVAGAFRDLIDSSRSESDMMGDFTRPELAVISDPLPPVGELKDHQADMLYRIVERRYAAKRPTVITINVADDDEADRRLGVATWDRLQDGAWKVGCFWESHRRPARVVGQPKMA